MPDDLIIAPQRGVPAGLTIPAAELVERFSRSSGPGGQGVNTTDSRVELRWDVLNSAAVTEIQRARLLQELAPRLVDGVLSIVASEQRSQLQNRTAARARLTNYLREALLPPPPPRRPRTPSRAAKARRVEAKRQRGDLKTTRRRPPPD
ncbi:alternative ribosome rescue aminoacyl-tRNA hydrolase ArfB [uncultured Jatrophihabitans sp.]|uniref:alternative ribosome rescue aminoacyl-tRNA hydrolase ArfB n=1 Tax=uncultured Jatrophihabitans sp. TaxID=1610747 RepID=UPI0035CA4344